MAKARIPLIPAVAGGLCLLAIGLVLHHRSQPREGTAGPGLTEAPPASQLPARPPSRPLPDEATLTDLANRIRAGDSSCWQDLQGLCAVARRADFERLWKLVDGLPDSGSMKPIVQAQILYELAAGRDLAATPELAIRLLPEKGDHFAARDAVLELLAAGEAPTDEYLRFIAALPPPSAAMEKRLTMRLETMLPELCASGHPLDSRSRRLVLNSLAQPLIHAAGSSYTPEAAAGASRALETATRAEQAGCLEKGAVTDLIGRLATASPATAAALAQQPGITGDDLSPSLVPALNDLATFETSARSRPVSTSGGFSGFAADAVPFSGWIRNDPAAAESWFRTHRDALPPSLADSIAVGFVFVSSFSSQPGESRRWIYEIRDPDLRSSYAAMVSR